MAQKSPALIGLAGAASIALLLSGCFSEVVRPPAPSPAPPPVAPAPPAPPPEPAVSVPVPLPRPAPPPRENHLSAATQSLVARARSLLAQGDPDGASATLDRALRIEPSNPLLWVELGHVRLVEGDAHQAESCAHKALALAAGDRRAQARAGHLLAEALRAQGRNQEAHEVELRPYMR